jgi:hypothetical protein
MKTETISVPVPKMRIYLGDIHRKGGAFPDKKKQAAKKKCRGKLNHE